MIGQTVSHYKITDKLGSGGMGEVYLAEDTDLKRKVALKFLLEADSATHEIATRFRHEAQAAAALSHPNIATVYEVSTHEGRPYIVMEHVDGPTLSKYCETEEPAIDEILDLAIQIGEGLKKAHAAGIVHRDLKPANILVDQDRRPKILDFGLAKLKGATKVTKTGSTLGTAAYMSPEQGAGQEVDHRTDIWSLGVILYEMIARRLPFDADHIAAITYAVANDTPHPLARYSADVPDELQRIVSKCLAKRPEERYQTVADLTADLRSLRRTTGGEPPSGAPRRKRSKLVSMTVAAVMILVVAVWGGLQLKSWLVPAKASAKSLAVVDFNNVGAEEDAYLASGLAEDLAVKLRRLAGFKVASSADIRRLTRENLLPREVATRLNVQYALGGSLLRQGDLVRVNVDLIDKESGDVVWSDQIDKQFTEIFQFLDEVSLKIAQALEVRLTPIEQAAIAVKPTENTQAYDYYLRGRQYYYNTTFRDNELAGREFERALQLDSDYPLALAGLADVYVQRYKERFDYDDYWLDSSEVLIRKVLTLDPNLAEAYESRAELYLQEDNITGARQDAKKAKDLRPEWDEPYIHLGNIYKGRGERSIAMAMLDTALSIRPSVEALCGKGNIFQTRGDMDSAKAVYQEAQRLHPYHDRPYLDLGRLHRELKDATEAERQFRHAIEVRPDRADGYNELSMILSERGLYQEAETLLRGFVEQYPYNWDGYRDLYDFVVDYKGEPSAAVQIVEDALSHNRERAWPHLMMASVYASRLVSESEADQTPSTSDAALRAIDQALALRPNSGYVLEWAGKVYIDLKRIDEAMEYFRRATELRPGSSALLFEIAGSLSWGREYEGSLAFAREAVRQSPGETFYYRYLCMALENLNRVQEFYDIIRQAAEQYGDDPVFLQILGTEERLAGRLKEAIRTYEQALARKPIGLGGLWEEGLTSLGFTLWLSGDTQGALDKLRQVGKSYRAPRLIVAILKSERRFDELEQYLKSIKQGTCEQASGFEIWAWLTCDYLMSMRRYKDALAVLAEYHRSGEETYPLNTTIDMAKCYLHIGAVDSAAHFLEGLLRTAVTRDDKGEVLAELALMRAVGAQDLTPALELAQQAYTQKMYTYQSDVIAPLIRLQYARGKTRDVKETLARLQSTSWLAENSYLKAQITAATSFPDAGIYLDQTVSKLTRLSQSVELPALDLWQAWTYRGLALARKGDAKEAARTIEWAVKLEPEREDVAYLAACAYSLMGDTTLALRWLKTAVERGYLELWWARVDPDLDPLRELPRFKQIMDDWDRRIQALLGRETR